MKTTERFERAVSKLYNAFHKGELNAFRCKHCAVGNICDNRADWAGSTLRVAPLILYTNKEAEKLSQKTGYTCKHLINIERIFMGCFDYRDIGNERDKQFKGLCAVVEYLCELDGIPNIMDYTSLFETENNEPKKQLEEVFSN